MPAVDGVALTPHHMPSSSTPNRTEPSRGEAGGLDLGQDGAGEGGGITDAEAFASEKESSKDFALWKVRCTLVPSPPSACGTGSLVPRRRCLEDAAFGVLPRE